MPDASWSSLPGNTKPGTYPTNTDVPSLNKILDPDFPNFQLQIPDQYRVDTWLPVFDQQEKAGSMPSLTFMWLMTDHTAPLGVGEPVPVAEVADNDLAVGRVVDAISHSPFWKSTAIFVLEDDPQNGVDHVDGHRSPVFVVSPYSKPGVDDEYYSQINMVRTIEQILGIHPMNQEDYAAEPMYDAFTDHPNVAPYDVVPNQIPLTLGVPGFAASLTKASAGLTKVQRADFRPQGVVPASMRVIYDAWVAWSRQEQRAGIFDGPDRAKPQLLNRLDWYSAHNWRVAYPGDKQIYAPDKVPGRLLPAALLGDG